MMEVHTFRLVEFRMVNSGRRAYVLMGGCFKVGSLDPGNMRLDELRAFDLTGLVGVCILGGKVTMNIV